MSVKTKPVPVIDRKHVYINVQLPFDLHARLKASAALAGRKMEDHIIEIIDSAVGNVSFVAPEKA